MARITGFAGGAAISVELDEGIAVPDVVGNDEATATSTLEGAGFVVAVASGYSASVPIGDVISQNPSGGASAPDGSTVTITVSLGPAADGYIGRPFNFNWWTQ